MAKKNQRELYRGPAIIMGISFESVADWKDWEKKDLSEVDKTNAFKIVYDVAEGDANGKRHDVKVEVSHRELKGDALEWYKREDGTLPTQIDVAMRTLVGQGIIKKGANENDLADAFDDSLCGHEVTIRSYEEEGKDGKWWPRVSFASKFRRVTGNERQAFLSAFLAGKPSPKIEGASANFHGAIPAPSDDEDVPDMPF